MNSPACTMLVRLRESTPTGQATLGGPGSELDPRESNQSMGVSFPEATAAILQDLIPDGILRICLEGNETPSIIKVTDEGDYRWVGVADWFRLRANRFGHGSQDLAEGQSMNARASKHHVLTLWSVSPLVATASRNRVTALIGRVGSKNGNQPRRTN